MISKITHLRKQIDTVDKKIIKLLSERMKIVSAIAKEKKKSKLSPYDSKRWHEVLENRKKIAKTLGLDAQMVEGLWEQIHKQAVEFIAEYEKE